MKVIFILIVLISTNAFSYYPTLESLLRNSNNVDVGVSSVVANLVIRELDPKTNTPLISEDKMAKQAAVKLLVFNENEERPRLVQVEFKGGAFNNSMLFDYKETTFYRLSSVVRNPEAVEAKSFYSVMGMLLNNNGSMLIEFLKDYNPQIKSNSQIINNRKVRLLGDYKRYLAARQKDKETGIENPLNPEDEEKKQRVSAIMKEGFLLHDDLVKRVKKKDDFSWVAKTDNLQVNFDSDHRIRDLAVNTPLGSLQYVFGRFLVFGGQFEFPEFIWFTDLTGRKYEIKAKSLKVINDSQKWYDTRLENYLKAKKENNFSETPFRPEFLL